MYRFSEISRDGACSCETRGLLVVAAAAAVAVVAVANTLCKRTMEASKQPRSN